MTLCLVDFSELTQGFFRKYLLKNTKLIRIFLNAPVQIINLFCRLEFYDEYNLILNPNSGLG